VTAPVLMVVGTASSVGKSVLVTAFCRIFADEGVRVAPFKAQNMSNNADVTPDGLEIGRAQSEQAAAARILPSVEMNPVLLKPQGDRTSQVVLNGRPAGTLHSARFLDRKAELWPHVTAALDALREQFELVIAEGAGSPAEPNLRAGDIVNMAIARYAGAVTLLAGDIDRGGVFAHLLGTLEYLPPEHRALVSGFLINRFRGDPALLTPAIEDLEGRTGVPVFGIVPWIDRLAIAQEDAVWLERAGEELHASTEPEPHDSARSASHQSARPEPVEGRPAGDPRRGHSPISIAILRFPRIANFDDFDPLRVEAGVRVRFVEMPDELASADLIVLPGTKATIADLAWTRERGLDDAVLDAAAGGTPVLGICGGFQMLGDRITDAEGVEASAGASVAGLGLLPVTTSFTPVKATRRVSGSVTADLGPWGAAHGAAIEGYEIHMGETWGAPLPLLNLGGRADGAVSPDGRVAGTYLHGLFHNDAFRAALLEGLGRPPPAAFEAAERREAEFDRLAAVVREHVDLGRIRDMLGV
jgi:adenosylcobyric acid synthase